MNEYVIQIKTDKNLGEESFVHNLLYSWYENKEEKMRPERFNHFEPIRHLFAKEGIDAAIQMWLKCRPLMLKRISNPKFEVDINWRREKGKDPREFPWNCCIWLNKKAGDSLAKAFLDFLIEHFEPIYGFVTTYEHEKSKHFFKFKSKRYANSTEEYFEGLDILTPFTSHRYIQQNTLPGIYWLTYFSHRIIDRLGPNKFTNIPAEEVFNYKNGILIQSHEECFKINKDAEDKIVNHLGKELFFDRDKYIKENDLEIVS